LNYLNTVSAARGHLIAREPPRRAEPPLPPWESLVVDAVGNVIEFWGFKANQGRVWALLYLRGRPLGAAEIREALGLSKGAVSMVTRELEQWGVVHRVRRSSATAWQFDAETELLRMVTRVIADREAQFIERVEADLVEGERQARASGSAGRLTLERIARMRALAELTHRAIQAFVKTARLDARGLSGVLKGATLQLVRKRKP
jgi:HTH-type transcriptional regulator, glycine betaine synthesis regulator